MLMKSVCRLSFLRHHIPKVSVFNTSFCFPKALFSEVYINRKTMSGEREIVNGLPLKDVISELNKFADLSLAESWDNVGLLIEPFTKTHVKKILLTNDLTEVVMQEAIKKNINLIISYHPPIFSALKRITNASWKERLVSACLENRIAVFSPHTSWDAVNGGVNDWLSDAFVDHIGHEGRTSITTSASQNPVHITTIVGPSTSIDDALKEFKAIENLQRSKGVESDICTIIATKDIINKLKNFNGLSFGTIKCEKNENQVCGMGRILQVNGLNVETCVKLIKKQICLPFVRLALAKDKSEDSDVRTIALCAGSGGSLLKGVKADLFVTGEMFHHDVLDANHNGTSVILTNHSDSERGFLKKMEKILQDTFKNNINITTSTLDSDPLKTV